MRQHRSGAEYLAALPRRSENAPGSVLPRLALARLAPLALLYSAPLDAARSKVPRWAARHMLATLAPPSQSSGVASACLRFRRQLGRCRRSPLLNVGARLAAGSPRVAGRVPLSRDRFGFTPRLAGPPVFLVRRNPDRFAAG